MFYRFADKLLGNFLRRRMIKRYSQNLIHISGGFVLLGLREGVGGVFAETKTGKLYSAEEIVKLQAGTP